VSAIAEAEAAPAGIVLDEEPHPVTTIFPRTSPADLQALTQDIDENGQRLPVLVDEWGHVIDGRARVRACEHLIIEPIVEVVPEETDLLALAVSLNVKRRSLKPGQLAMAAAMAWDMLESGHGGLRQEGASDPLGKRSVRLAQMFGCGYKSIEKARFILAKQPDLAARVHSGKVQLGAAYEELRPPIPPMPLSSGNPSGEVTAIVVPPKILRNPVPLSERMMAERSDEELAQVRAQEKLHAWDTAEYDAQRLRTAIERLEPPEDDPNPKGLGRVGPCRSASEKVAALLAELNATAAKLEDLAAEIRDLLEAEQER
jgi:hypothetical protein